MKLEAVIVCVNYHDFLAQTILQNKSLFNRLVVVTSTADKKTQKLCEHHYVHCVRTDVFYEEGAPFNKGKGINEGLKHLDMDGWVVHMDADIILPPKTRSILETLDLDESFIYGIDRLMCNSGAEWIDYLAHPRLIHETEAYIHLKAFPVGTRLMKPGRGYLPIGFFQMWNPKKSGVYIYPTEHTNAGRSDMLFAMEWPRRKIGFLPEIVGIHIATPSDKMGANWNGRKTPPFLLDDPEYKIDEDCEGY